MMTVPSGGQPSEQPAPTVQPVPTVQPPALTEEQRELQNYFLRKLNGQVFVGSYTERSYITEIEKYRDLVSVAGEEVEFRATLERICRRSSRRHLRWCSVKKEGEQFILWSELDDVPLGRHWFQVKAVIWTMPGVLEIRVKHLREANLKDYTEKKEDNSETNEPKVATDPRDVGAAFLAFVHSLVADLRWHHVKTFVQFVGMLLAVAITAAYRTFHVVFLHGPRYIDSFSRLVHVAMPFLMGTLELVGKTIGAVFLLVYSMIRGVCGPRGSVPPPPQVMLDWRPEDLRRRDYTAYRRAVYFRN